MGSLLRVFWRKMFTRYCEFPGGKWWQNIASAHTVLINIIPLPWHIPPRLLRYSAIGTARRILDRTFLPQHGGLPGFPKGIGKRNYLFDIDAIGFDTVKQHLKLPWVGPFWRKHRYVYAFHINLQQWNAMDMLRYTFNSLGPSDATWRWRSWSTLVRVMAWRHQAITWTNVDLSSVRSCGIHLRTLS